MKAVEERYAHWRSIMSEYEASGLSQQKFCEANDINFKQFKYYRWQLSKLSNKKVSTEPIEVKLAPVTLKQVSNSSKLYLKHPTGIECQIPSDISESQLLKLIQGLLAC